jgi:uncharacterized glyoxalase superfamily protein PhnB
MPDYKPAQYNHVSPYIMTHDIDALVSFITKVFDGELTENMTDENGKSVHAEMRIGDSSLMLGGADPLQEPMPQMLYVYVPDTDDVYKKGLAEGATSLEEPDTKFYGDRNAGLRDVFGNVWWIATHVEDVSPEEMERRAKEMEAKGMEDEVPSADDLLGEEDMDGMTFEELPEE